MNKVIRAAISVSVISCCCATAAISAEATWFAERQFGLIQGQKLEAFASWVDGRRGIPGPFTKATANEQSIGFRTRPLAAAAAVLNFGDSGLQIDHLAFSYFKLKEGVIFDETTPPIVRVEYANKTTPTQHRFKTLNWDNNSVGFTFDSQNLSRQGLPAESTIIYRFGIVAKPKLFKYLNDYASMEIQEFRYHDYLSSDRDTQVPQKNLNVIIDGGGNGNCTDELLLGA